MSFDPISYSMGKKSAGGGYDGGYTDGYLAGREEGYHVGYEDGIGEAVGLPKRSEADVSVSHTDLGMIAISLPEGRYPQVDKTYDFEEVDTPYWAIEQGDKIETLYFNKDFRASILGEMSIDELLRSAGYTNRELYDLTYGECWLISGGEKGCSFVDLTAMQQGLYAIIAGSAATMEITVVYSTQDFDFTSLGIPLAAKAGWNVTEVAFDCEIKSVSFLYVVLGTALVSKEPVWFGNGGGDTGDGWIGQATLQSKSVTVTQNGTQTVTADTGYDGLSSVSVTTNVQGNPNYVETIEGTLANPWGDIDRISLRDKIQNNDVTTYISFKDASSSVRIFLRYESGLFGGDCSTFLGAALTGAYYIQYNNSGTLDVAKKYSSNGTASNFPDSTACTLTIIHHPLPSSGT